jgi:NRPS condensation-like uncharacterized protein
MKLNSFQKLMKSWTALGPYNAAQAMCISGIPDVGRWRSAIHTTIKSVGLGSPRITGDSVEFESVAEIKLRIAGQNLATEIEHEINLPFASGEIPLRFTLVTETDRYWLLVVYDHWLADSWSIRQLMHMFSAHYAGAGGAPNLRTTTMDFHSTFRRRLGWMPGLTGVTTAMRQYSRHKHVWRLYISDRMNFSIRILIRPFPDGLIERLAAKAKKHNCTINDLFLAAAAAALGRHILTRYDIRQGRWPFIKSGMGMGTIVDVRAQADHPLDDVFGLYLSFFTLVLKKPEARPFVEVIDEVARHTRRFKSRDDGVKSYCAIDVAWMLWRLYDKLRHASNLFHGNNFIYRACNRGITRIQADFFRRSNNVLAGISNVNLTGSWMHPGPSAAPSPLPVVDYLRISPAGPLLPMVFALTTLGSKMSLCFTWRKTTLDSTQVETLLTDFMNVLEEFAA